MTDHHADHPGLQWLNESEAGSKWLGSLDQIVAECCEEWSLIVDKAFSHAFTSLALAVSRRSTPAVLKIQFPDRESQYESDALAHWNGDGAVQLLEVDRDRRALLLERCVPGTALATAGPEIALTVLTELVGRLSVPIQSNMTTLTGEAAHWSESLERQWKKAGKPFERRLLDIALSYLRDLPGSQGEQILLNQDLHSCNVLQAQREPWLVIDPKPLVGEREFAVASIVRDDELGHRRDLVQNRFNYLVTTLGLDRERALGWTIGQTVAWSVGAGATPRHLEVVRWLLDLGPSMD